ncbi:MAG: cell division protein ZapA [Candidatus Marinimicrobia bacterium]|nr:cell division protein ZapA [Candidatus Neomarinimicrobiota bacterium]
MENESNQVLITIYGQEYSIKAPADPDYIKSIAEFVDEKMREVQQSFSTTQSSTRIAILAAMNISDELMTLRKNSDSGDLDIEEKLSTLIEFIDDSLNQ